MNAATIGLAGIVIGSMTLSIAAARWNHRWLAIGAALNTALALGGIVVATEVFV